MDMEFIEIWFVSNVEKISFCLKKGRFWFICENCFYLYCDFFEFLIVGRENILVVNERERGGVGELIIMIILYLLLNCFF